MIHVAYRSTTVSSRLIGVQTPSFILVFLDYFTDVLVMPDFNAFVFIRQDFTPSGTID
jgi:hypothetical protein